MMCRSFFGNEIWHNKIIKVNVLQHCSAVIKTMYWKKKLNGKIQNKQAFLRFTCDYLDYVSLFYSNFVGYFSHSVRLCLHEIEYVGSHEIRMKILDEHSTETDFNILSGETSCVNAFSPHYIEQYIVERRNSMLQFDLAHTYKMY